MSSCCARLFDCAADMSSDTCICAQDTSGRDRSPRGERRGKRVEKGGGARSKSRPPGRDALPGIPESEHQLDPLDEQTQRLQFTYEVCMCWRACVCDCGIAPASEHHLLDWHIPLVTQYPNYTCCQRNEDTMVLICAYTCHSMTYGCNCNAMVAIAPSCVAILASLLPICTHGCN
jgi:hypothetical protein